MITGTKARKILSDYENCIGRLTDQDLDDLVEFLKEFCDFLREAHENSIYFNYRVKLDRFQSYQRARKE